MVSSRISSDVFIAIIVGAVVFVLNVVMIALDAPLVLRPFYWTAKFVVQMRALAAWAGDVMGRVYVYLAYVIDRFAEKLGPAFWQSVASLVEFATLVVVVVRDFAVHLLETIRASDVYAYVVHPYVLVGLSVVGTLLLVALVVQRYRPLWWTAFRAFIALEQRRAPDQRPPTTTLSSDAVPMRRLRDRGQPGA